MVELQAKMSPEEEIKKLEQQLEQKKRELAAVNAPERHEKEVFREVLKEHIGSLRPSLPEIAPAQPSAPVVAPSPQDEQKKMRQQEAHDATVRMLVQKALVGTIEDAVKAAQKISPNIVDDLHDHLVDDKYDQLIVLRKIKQL